MFVKLRNCLLENVAGIGIVLGFLLWRNRIYETYFGPPHRDTVRPAAGILLFAFALNFVAIIGLTFFRLVRMTLRTNPFTKRLFEGRLLPKLIGISIQVRLKFWFQINLTSGAVTGVILIPDRLTLWFAATCRALACRLHHRLLETTHSSIWMSPSQVLSKLPILMALGREILGMWRQYSPAMGISQPINWLILNNCIDSGLFQVGPCWRHLLSRAHLWRDLWFDAVLSRPHPDGGHDRGHLHSSDSNSTGIRRLEKGPARIQRFSWESAIIKYNLLKRIN